ncbi:c-type cytochrome [Acidisoma cellulosilytica]|uniref:C-type cytochrome n=1 Tax=Acidisoma cellulosilyticum TaxID=2802395 RepID=A0A964E2V1_9PROT|nr:c-type cytochrome [Acidisoma cellulosilyticum]MCB8879796.1 c-type cytochrome [Acidisoma cellulosilyticum]
MFTFRRIALLVIALAVLGCLGAGGLYAFNRVTYANQIAETTVPAPTADQIKRGHYLALAGDCVACHTAPGGAPYAGGLQLNTGFGIVAASNITPDRDTGIGGWTTKQFILAMHRGIGDHGKRLYPAMPYTAYAKVSDADLTDIKAYLDTLPPVNHAVIANQMPFPFNIRLMMIGWNMLFFDFGGAEYKADPTQTAEWNRGAYLVQGLEHCSTCHTTKNFLGADEAGKFLHGTDLDGWWAPDLTSNTRIGLGSWSEDDIVTFLKTGANDRMVAAGPMAEAVTNSTQHLTVPDLHAMAVYLKSIPASDDTGLTPVPPTDPQMVAGRAIYGDNCAACHVLNATGVPGMAPAFVLSPSVQAQNPENMIRTILAGGHVAVTETNPTGAAMPAFDWKLSDAQIAAVTTYLRNSWGNAAGPVTADQVAAKRQQIGARERN